MRQNEIYLSDPRIIDAAKRKTVLLYPAKKYRKQNPLCDEVTEEKYTGVYN
jgi:hypothetical protein